MCSGGRRFVLQDGGEDGDFGRVAGSDQFASEAATVLRIFFAGEHRGEFGADPVGLAGAGERFGGVPRLDPGGEYLLFLWRGPSGITQITGLSQGLMEIQDGPAGDRIAIREPSPDLLIAPRIGVAVKDLGLRMRVDEVILRIHAILEAEGQATP